MALFVQLVLWLGGLGFAAFGVAFLLAPLETFALAGIRFTGAAAAAEIMAFYGGLELALGALLLTCALRPARRRDGLLLMTAAYASIALARLAGMLIHGADDSFLRLALVIEAGLAVLAAAGLLLGAGAAPATQRDGRQPPP